MNNNTIFSPHCDDALLALGGHILYWGEAEVVTVFGTCAWTRLDTKLSVEQITLINQQEETTALKEANCISYRYNLPEVLMRNYRKWNTKFIHESDNSVFNKSISLIKKHVKQNSSLYFPLAVEGHVDHVLLRNAAFKLYNFFLENNCRVYLYEDLPYSWYEDPSLTATKLNLKFDVKTEVLDISINLNQKLKLLDYYKSQLGPNELSKVKEYAARINQGKYSERIWRIC